MATFSKTYATLFALASTAASTVAISSAVDVSTKMGGAIYVRFGRRNATAAGAGVNIRLEASHASSGDNSWFPFAIFTTAFAATGGDEAITGTNNAGQKVIQCAATAGLAAGDVIFIDNNTGGTLNSTSEWARIKSIVTNTSVTIEDDLVNAQTATATPSERWMFDSAEIFPPVAIPAGVSRIRAVLDGSLFTQAFATEIRYTTIDGIA